jgi:hypothetical protein
VAGRITAPGQRLHSPYVNQLDVAEQYRSPDPKLSHFLLSVVNREDAAPARREHEIRFTLDAKMDHVGSSLSGAWFAPC